jgi:energy-coupling factor transporter ATP-binding protein EcfA2
MEKEKIINDILKDHHLLDRYLQDISKVYVGREEEILLLRILMELRKTDEGICIYIIGESGEGKSTLVKTILYTINPEDVIYYTDISPMALKNLKEINLSHKVFYFSEGDAIEDKNGLVYHIRSAISEGEIKSITATREGKAGVEENRIETKGTIFLTTNEKIYKDRELDRRSIVIRLDYDPLITKEYFEWVKNPKNFNPDYSHLAIWQEVDKMLQPIKVCVPYWKVIVENFPKDKSRYKTDIRTTYRMLCAITQIHQYQRERNEKGEYIATLQDYEILYKLSPLLVGSIDLPETHKAIINVLAPYKENGLTREEIIEKLKEKGIIIEYETLRKYLGELRGKEYILIDGKGKQQKIYPVKNISDFNLLPSPDVIKEYIHNSNPKFPIQVKPLTDNEFHWENPNSQKIPKSQFEISQKQNCEIGKNWDFDHSQSQTLDSQGFRPNWEIGNENVNKEIEKNINNKSELNSENTLIQKIKNKKDLIYLLNKLKEKNPPSYEEALNLIRKNASKDYQDISDIENDNSYDDGYARVFLACIEDKKELKKELLKIMEVQNEKI